MLNVTTENPGRNGYLVASGVVMVFERVGNGDQFVQVASNTDIPNLTSFV